ncbi:MAG: AAA family ATPase [Bacteroidota bacterium]
MGTDSFAELLVRSDVFVDKTLFIKEFLENVYKVSLITRPRRWGKSLNVDMLKCFLAIEVDSEGNPIPQAQSSTYKLFAGGEVALDFQGTRQLQPLKISKYPALMEQQGQHPVISIGFKDVDGSSYQHAEAQIRMQISDLYVQHRYLKQYARVESTALEEGQKAKLQRYFTSKSTQEDVKDGLRFLSKLLYKHFGKKVYILIDEYDTPINSAYLERERRPQDFLEVVKLFQGLLGAALKDNPYLQQGLVTGILRIAKASFFSGLNNAGEYTLLDETFSTAYGFTQEEVDELLHKVRIDTPTEKIQEWYNGYKFIEETTLYNPWSIMCCLGRKGEIGPYWLDSGGTSLIDSVLRSDEMQQDLQALVARQDIVSRINKHISFDDIDTPLGLRSLLLFGGYLNASAVAGQEDRYKLSIPNNEVRHIYEIRLVEWVSRKLKIDITEYESLMYILSTGQIEVFAERLQALLHASTSFYQTGQHWVEVFYAGFVLGLFYSLAGYYDIESERESGLGRVDMLLIPKATYGDQAIVIEYKVGQKVESLSTLADKGLAQIVDKQYNMRAKTHSHVKRLLQVCLAFCGKEVVLKHAQIDLS